MLKLLHPLLKGRRVVKRKVLPRLPLLRLRRVRFLGNLPLLSPKLSADSSPAEPSSNPTQRHSTQQPISLTSLPLISEGPTAPLPFPSPALSMKRAQCHCSVQTFTPLPPLTPPILLPLLQGSTRSSRWAIPLGIFLNPLQTRHKS